MRYVLFHALTCTIPFAAIAKESPSPPLSIENSSAPSSEPHVGFGQSGLGVSSNPAAVNIFTGTGKLGGLFGAPPDTGLRLGGMYLADGNQLLAGGISNQKLTGNSLLVLSLCLDFEKMSYWKGGMFGIEFLQFNGMNTDVDAGVFPSYNSLPGQPPLDRSELYQLWYRQAFFEDRLIFRIGKTVPTYDFNNVLRPVPTRNETLSIPSVSGLIYTPIFVNPTMLGVMPGYYNSAYGVTLNIAPWDSSYLSYGIYDGSLANGTQTGLTGPHFNGYSFQVAEVGKAWEVGAQTKPGLFAFGGWYQSGKLSADCKTPLPCCNEEEVDCFTICQPPCPEPEPPPCKVTEQGTGGLYLFGSQRLWFCRPGRDNSGISGFYQAGWNFSRTLPIQKYVGLGFTAFALTRPNDSMGVGMAWSWMNEHSFHRSSQLMFQGYYQGNIYSTIYLQPVLSYIPTPSLGVDTPQTWAFTLRLITLF